MSIQQKLRLLIQCAVTVLVALGFPNILHGMGLPRYIFVPLVLLAGMFYCGWWCPFGAIQDWLRSIGKNLLHITLPIPEKVDKYLSWLRYVLLVVGILAILPDMNFRRAYFSLITGQVLEISLYIGLGIFLILSLVTERPFCRYICGFGALFGLLSMARVFTVRRNADKCANCLKCDKACVMGIKVSKQKNIRSPHCINCLNCTSSCPVPAALTFGPALPRLKDFLPEKRKTA